MGVGRDGDLEHLGLAGSTALKELVRSALVLLLSLGWDLTEGVPLTGVSTLTGVSQTLSGMASILGSDSPPSFLGDFGGRLRHMSTAGESFSLNTTVGVSSPSLSWTVRVGVWTAPMETMSGESLVQLEARDTLAGLSVPVSSMPESALALSAEAELLQSISTALAVLTLAFPGTGRLPSFSESVGTMQCRSGFEPYILNALRFSS